MKSCAAISVPLFEFNCSVLQSHLRDHVEHLLTREHFPFHWSDFNCYGSDDDVRGVQEVK